MKKIKADKSNVSKGIECYLENYLMHYRLESHNTSILDEYMNRRRDVVKYRDNSYADMKKESIGLFSLKYLYPTSEFLLTSLKT